MGRGPEAAPSAFTTVGAGEPRTFGNTQLTPEQFRPLVKPAKGTAVQIERTVGKVRIGGTAYIGDTKAYAEAPKPLPKPAGGTVARAEGAHAFVAITKGIKVEIATNQPGPGFLGMVRTGTPDADVMAAHLETPGSWSDRQKLVYLMKADPDASYRRAQNILKNDPDGYDATTRVIEQERSVTGERIIQAIHEEKKRKEYVLITLITPDGRVIKKQTRAKNGEVEIEETSLPQHDTIFKPHLTKKNMALAA